MPNTTRKAKPTAPPPEVAITAAAPATKSATLIALLRRPQGARLDELCAATGWQPHSVRGAIAGALKKKLGLSITSRPAEGGRVYRIEEAQA